MTSRRSLRTLAVAGALVCALAACAGGSGSGSDAAAGTDGSKVIKIGISSIQSGPAASSGVGLECTVKNYFDEAQKAGTLNGYTFEVVSRDHQYDPSRAANIAREFVQDDVFAVLTDGTATMRAALPAVQPRDIPIFAYADGALFTKPDYPRMYGINPDYAGQARQGAKLMLDQLGVRKVGIAYLNSEAGEPSAKAFPEYITAHGGEVVASEAIAANATDYTAQAQNLKAAGAEAVYTNLLDTGLAAMQKAADAVGYHPKWVSWAQGSGPVFYKLAGPLAAGTYVQLLAAPRTGAAEDANTQQFRDVIAACGDNATEQASAFGAGIIRAVQKATANGQELTRDGFVEALAAHGEQIGAVQSVTWDDTTHAGATKTAYYQVGPAPGLELTKVTDFADLPA
jgi:ABC-type branched-subunit amino acid transport system substrate-binding protein